MDLRIAFSTTLALVGAALAVSACEPEPTVCAPKIDDPGPGPAPDPECTACVDDKCSGAGDDCSSECEAYGACTCDCAEDDLACFQACADNRSESCASCQQEAGNAVVSCIMSQCQVCAGGGSSASAGDGQSDAGSWTGTDDGGSSWTASDDGGSSWTSTDDGSSWTASDDGGSDPSWTGTDDGGSGGAACDELHAQCCPNLDGFDRELCETTTDDESCAIWLEIFQGEGKC